MKVPLLGPSLRLGALLMVAGVTPVVAQAPPAGANPAAPKLIVARDTTYLTEPLDSQGNVDFAAALERRLSHGVTPENNAALPLWRALGPPKGADSIREEYFRRLGMAPPPEGTGYRNWHAIVERPEFGERDYISDVNDWIRASSFPWTKEKHPWLSTWLDENHATLEALIVASKCTRRYEPILLFEPEMGLAGTWTRLAPELIDLCRLLRTRAMLHAGSGRFDAACDDLAALDRLASLASQGWSTLDLACAEAIDDGAGQACLSLLEQPGLTREHVRRLRRNRRAAPRLTPPADLVDVGDRVTMVDLVLLVRREGMWPLVQLTRLKADALGFMIETKDTGLAGKKPATIPVLDDWVRNRVDWNPVLRRLNARYDELVSVMRRPIPERRAKIAELLAMAEKSPPGMKLRLPDVAIPPPEQTIDAAVQMMLQYGYRDVLFQIEVHDRAEAQRRLNYLALDLAEFRLIRGRYPERLAELDAIEEASARFDPYTEREFFYRRTNDGYVVYSPGPNLRDDDGKTKDDAHRVALETTAGKTNANLNEVKPDWDDIRVRMPHRPER